MYGAGVNRVDISIIESLKRRCNWKQNLKVQKTKGKGGRNITAKVGGDPFS